MRQNCSEGNWIQEKAWVSPTEKYHIIPTLEAEEKFCDKDQGSREMQALDGGLGRSAGLHRPLHRRPCQWMGGKLLSMS